MTNANPKVQYPGLRGSKQHHDLKDEPGEDGDQDHMDDGAEPSEELKDAVEGNSSETEIGDALKRAVSDKDD